MNAWDNDREANRLDAQDVKAAEWERLWRAVMETPDAADPLEPEPEDDEETITYPDVWDRAGDRVVIWSCVAALALFWGAPIALSVWAVTR